MYLTRMELDTRRRDTLKVLASLSKLHGIVESAFNGPKKRNLWRIDSLNNKIYLMILSEDKPDLTQAADKYAPAEELAWQTKDYSNLLLRVKNGTVWRFRLTANPTKSVAVPGKRGKVKACVTVNEQKEWLLKRAEANGFILKDEQFDVVHSKWHAFEKGSDDKREVTLRGVTYEGILLVEDEERFKQLLINGIGRAKAYGMGLMTLISNGQ